MPGVELISSSTLLLTKARVWTPGAVSPRAVRQMEKLQDDKSWCPQGLCQLWGSAEPPRSLPGYFFCLEIQVLPKLCPIEEEAGWGLGRSRKRPGPLTTSGCGFICESSPGPASKKVPIASILIKLQRKERKGTG